MSIAGQKDRRNNYAKKWLELMVRQLGTLRQVLTKACSERHGVALARFSMMEAD